MTELSPYQRDLRDRLSSVPVLPAPAPWQPVFEPCAAVGGLLGIGFATHPDSGNDLLMVVSTAGHGLFDADTGERIARDRDPDPETGTPDAAADLTCPGLGPVAGSRVHPGPHGERWWHVFHSDYSELRAVGFSPSGRTLAVATSSDVTLWRRPPRPPRP
jgi:hypothetical protein